jgi:hypothetical protein
MAKQFEIVFSGTEDFIANKDEDGNEKKTKTLRSEAEKLVLKNIFYIAAAAQKDISASLECKDCISQIDNLKDGEILLLTEGDLKYVAEGYGKTIDKRPFLWMEQCENLFRQIAKPKEHKKEE